ncbi:MAG: hypothetical protein HYY44_07785 [Deltaproteobacteria bacterium]|nr:hypothetical protein [Deltaproteobacteria bacterium]MBI4373699.1 hypothetical protein [Deltaproteobacteria bacterium]
MERAQLSPTFYFRAQKKYGGKYIAREKNRVLASAKHLKDLYKIMKTKKIRHEGEVSIGYVPRSDTSYVYILR